MAAASLGDRREWVLSLLDRYEVPLTRFAARLLGDRHAARDVVQHTFLRLCDQSPGDLQDRVAQWLFTVCRNKAVDLLRARGRTESLGKTEQQPWVSKEPDPAAVAEKRDLHRRINGLVEGLPPSQREAVGLWSEGFSYRQIAEMVDRSEGAVRVLIHRALKQLRRHPLVCELLGGPAEVDRLPQPESTKLV